MDGDGGETGDGAEGEVVVVALGFLGDAGDVLPNPFAANSGMVELRTPLPLLD